MHVELAIHPAPGEVVPRLDHRRRRIQIEQLPDVVALLPLGSTPIEVEHIGDLPGREPPVNRDGVEDVMDEVQSGGLAHGWRSQRGESMKISGA